MLLSFKSIIFENSKNSVGKRLSILLNATQHYTRIIWILFVLTFPVVPTNLCRKETVHHSMERYFVGHRLCGVP